MNDTRGRRQQLFVVCFWLEVEQGRSTSWRGMVEHVHFDRKLYFTSLNDLTDFITLRLKDSPQTGSGEQAFR